MADTGAPWNIPFAEPTDLVRDWPQLSEDVADAVAAGLSAASKIVQVVQGVKSDATTLSGSAGFTVVPNLSVSITPTSDTSKVLVVAVVSAVAPDAGSGQVGGQFTLFRETTNLSAPTSPGTRSAGFAHLSQGGLTRSEFILDTYTTSFLDSPNTDTAITYAVAQRLASGGILYVNRSSSDTDDSSRVRAVSTITAIEVAA